MDPQRWAKIESLYHAALAKGPVERPDYLAAACAQEPELRREVESLLGAANADLRSPLVGDRKWVGDRNWLPGFRLGAYEILAPLGAKTSRKQVKGYGNRDAVHRQPSSCISVSSRKNF